MRQQINKLERKARHITQAESRKIFIIYDGLCAAEYADQNKETWAAVEQHNKMYGPDSAIILRYTVV